MSHQSLTIIANIGIEPCFSPCVTLSLSYRVIGSLYYYNALNSLYYN